MHENQILTNKITIMTTETNKTFEITSTITINPTPKSIIVCFHVGIGGYHNNPGYKTYNPNVKTIQDIYNSVDNCFINCEDEDGNTLPDDEWTLTDQGGNIILEGRKEIESPVGILEWDTIYDTDIVKYLEDCTDEEIELIMKAYQNYEIENNDLIELIDNSIRNHKPIKTLEELADYYNVCRDYQSDFADIISDNGWHDDTHEACGICHDDEGNRVELNEEGNAEVIYA